MGGPRMGEAAGLPDGLLAARLAALCAAPDRRTALTERTLRAIAASSATAIAGTALERCKRAPALARELSDHLRALLRDVVCGHLPSDLSALADELLLAGDEADEQPSEQPAHLAQASPSEPRAGRIVGSSGKQPLGDQGQPAEVLHVSPAG